MALTPHPGISNSLLPKCEVCSMQIAKMCSCSMQIAVGVRDLRNQFRSIFPPQNCIKNLVHILSWGGLSLNCVGDFFSLCIL